MKKNYAYNKNKNVSVKQSMKNSVDCKKKQKRKSNDYNSLRQNKLVSDNNKKLKIQSVNLKRFKKDKLYQKLKKQNLKNQLGCKRRKKSKKNRKDWSLKDKWNWKRNKLLKNNKWKRKNTANDDKKNKKRSKMMKMMNTYQMTLQNTINQVSYLKHL